MNLLVVGSVALDSVETPFGKVEEVLGGSATYFSVAASLLASVRMVAVVGEDFPRMHIDMLTNRGIDVEGLEQVPGRTFRWTGQYGYDLNQAVTLNTQLNVFEDFNPLLPEGYKNSDIVFLANIHPALQLKVLEQAAPEAFTGADTMNFWIEREKKTLEEVFRLVRCVTINEAEAREFAGESNLFRAVRMIAGLGPEYVVVKRGEYGALLWHNGEAFFMPAYPLEEVFDPTGAGDTFAGGLFGYISASETCDPETLRRGLLVGSVLASYNVEDFSLRRLLTVTSEQIMERVNHFGEMTRVDTEEMVLSQHSST